ncbi:MAG: glycoside hydrolase family 32 protein [Thermoguttaceae bacterium]
MQRGLLAAVLLVLSAVAAAAEDDILIADFEGADYGAWTVEGEAFGPGPAEGTLDGQMHVSGYRGKRLVNSYYGGDGTTGRLTSPAFKIERKRINFLIGGGGYEKETYLALLVDGRPVRTATGPNTTPGGSEALQWQSWDVGEFAGKSAVIQIVDGRTGGWGHINVDQIVQSDRTMTLPPEELQKLIRLEKYFLNLPVKNGAAKRRMELVVDGKAVRIFNIELAPDEPDWWAHIEISGFRGKEAVLKVNAMEPGSGGLKLVDQTDRIKGHETLYDEPLRPQFHFSQQRGWNNDPNGMVFYGGEYHLFFQHNPYGWGWDNMHWGHAVSRDMVHWQELGEALYPWTQAVEHCFSGSGTVDEGNTAGFQAGAEKVIIAAFTDTGCGEAIAYSNDRGRTFTYYEGNPVVKHQGRDPKVFWYQPGGFWVMACYDEEGKGESQKRRIAFYSSADLKRWELESKLDGFFECPEIFELPVDGDASSTRWVVYAADARYVIGDFDGKTFTPEHEGKHQVHWGRYYASQTFNCMPDGRRVQIGWGRIDMEGMPFNQMMTFPSRLTLRRTPEGVRMFAEPIDEIELLHRQRHAVEGGMASPEKPLSVKTAGRLFDIRAELTLGDAKRVGLQIGPRRVVYVVAGSTLEEMPLVPVDGKIRLQVLVDRPSIEIWGGDGRVVKTDAFRSEGDVESISVFSEEGSVKVDSLVVYELTSAWKQ